VDELGAFLRDEIDMRHEAQNMRRCCDALPGITQPHVVEPYATRDVLVQDRSHGTRLEAAYGTAAAPALARALLDAYVHQLFGAGVFHADPHPGNLFFFDDGRLCLHDFGSIGVLDPASGSRWAAWSKPSRPTTPGRRMRQSPWVLPPQVERRCMREST
jgi:ubiquinone biosynthesis protein